MPWFLFVLLVAPTLASWWARRHYEQIAWRHLTPVGERAESDPSMRRGVRTYKREYFDAAGWKAYRRGQLFFWLAPAWWIVLFYLAIALGWMQGFFR